MRKVLAVSIGLVLLASVVILAGGMSREDAAKTLSSAVSSQGYNCDVEVGDVDENGVDDFAVEYKSGKEDEQILMLIATVTGAVAAIVPQLGWQSDKVFVLVHEDLFWANTADCSKCYKLIEKESSTDEDVEECLHSIWNEK